MKLFEITLEATVYAVGASQEEALNAARDGISLSDLNLFNDLDIIEVNHEQPAIYAAWAKCYPYGSDNDLTVEEWRDRILENERKEKERLEWEAKQLRLF